MYVASYYQYNMYIYERLSVVLLCYRKDMIQSLLCLLMFNCCIIMVKPEWKFSTVNINVSDNCKAAIQRLSELEVSDPQLMAYYWDSWGKPSDGILTGHTAFLGYYDECIDLKNTAMGETKYCIYSMIMETNTSLTNAAEGVCISSECSAPVNKSSVINIKVGVCYPSQCSSTEFETVLSTMAINNIATTTSPFSNKIYSYTTKLKSTSDIDLPAFCPDTNVEFDIGAVVVIIVCGILIGLVVVGTTMDQWLLLLSSNRSFPEVTNETEIVQTTVSNDKLQQTGKQITIRDFVFSFSLYKTVPKLVSTKQSISTIKGLNAIKIFFNYLIVIHHLFRFAVFELPFTSQNSPQYLNATFSSFIFQPTLNSTFLVDAFFLASATLSAYLTFKDMEKHKKFRSMYFYLNRFFRLSPMYYLFMFIAYKLSVHFGQGPVWFSLDYHSCTDTWWYNIFYLINTLPLLDMCMPVTWHISVDMQLFIFSPVFIVLLYHSLYYGLIAIAATMIAATATVGFMAAKYDYWAALLANPQYINQLNGLYIHPIYRINTYLIGILLGYILYKKHNIATLPIGNWVKQLIYLALWSTAIYLCTVPTLFGTYGEYSHTHHFTDFENITFLMFSGLTFSTGLSIIIYICNTSYGGMFSSVLSWPGWDPVARLIYGVMLIHIMVIFYILGTLQSSLKYTDTVFTIISVFTIVVSYGLSAVIAVCVELPIANVVSLCFKLAGMEPRSN